MSVIRVSIQFAIINNAMKVTVPAIIRVSFFPSGGLIIFSIPVHIIYRPKTERIFTKINDSINWLRIWQRINGIREHTIILNEILKSLPSPKKFVISIKMKAVP